MLDVSSPRLLSQPTKSLRDLLGDSARETFSEMSHALRHQRISGDVLTGG